MDTKRLTYFLKILETGSISRAAAYFNMAQPAMSQHLAILEAELRAKLFTRSVQGATPTEAGRALQRHARLVLRQMEEAQADLRTLGTGGRSVVAVGLPTSTALLLGTRLLETVRTDRTDIHLQLTEATSGFVLDMMHHHRLDLAVVFESAATRGLPLRPLWREELLLVVPPGTDLPPIVALEALATFDLIMPIATHSTRMLLGEVLSARGLKPRIVAEVDSLATLCTSVAAGLAYTVLPWSAVQVDVRAGRLSVVRIAGDNLSRSVSLWSSTFLPQTEVVAWTAAAIRALARQAVRANEMFGLIGVEAPMDEPIVDPMV
jgi:LysR family nitrogen assimilation transcriptional regulator